LKVVGEHDQLHLAVKENQMTKTKSNELGTETVITVNAKKMTKTNEIGTETLVTVDAANRVILDVRTQLGNERSYVCGPAGDNELMNSFVNDLVAAMLSETNPAFEPDDIFVNFLHHNIYNYLFEGQPYSAYRVANSFGGFPYILRGVNGKWTMTATFSVDNMEDCARFVKFWQDNLWRCISGAYPPKKSANQSVGEG
jgi:hypothetical protein